MYPGRARASNSSEQESERGTPIKTQTDHRQTDHRRRVFQAGDGMANPSLHPPSSPEDGPSGLLMWCRYSGLLRWVMETPRTPVTFAPAAQILVQRRHEAPWRVPRGAEGGSRSPYSWLRLIGLRHFEITGLPGTHGGPRSARRSPPRPPRKLDKRPTGAAPAKRTALLSERARNTVLLANGPSPAWAPHSISIALLPLTRSCPRPASRPGADRGKRK